MIFGDINQPTPEPERVTSPRRRRRRSSSASRESSERGRRRSIAGLSLREASRLKKPVRDESDGNAKAWLWVLALLAVGALGFGVYLHYERTTPRRLVGEAPSSALLPFIDPILAPLETGISGHGQDALSDLQTRLRAEGEKVNIDDKEVYATAATIAQILQEAQQDRMRHLDRLLKLGASVEGMTPDPEARTDISDTERKHLELAVDISWQRNSSAYRNRVEELWYRQLRLEQGRFGGGSAPQSMLSQQSYSGLDTPTSKGTTNTP